MNLIAYIIIACIVFVVSLIHGLLFDYIDYKYIDLRHIIAEITTSLIISINWIINLIIIAISKILLTIIDFVSNEEDEDE